MAKYYVYISDTKVEMLLGGMPEPWWKQIAAEMKVELGPLKAQFLSKAPGKETRVQRLEKVVEHILKREKVGTAAFPRSYFQETMEMRWGPYCRQGLKDPSQVPPLVFFAGSKGPNFVGLGGSMRHVLGAEGMKFEPEPVSATPFLMSYLLWEQDTAPSEYVVDPDQADPWKDLPVAVRTLRSVEQAVEHTLRNPSQPLQSLEFLAKRLEDGRSEIDPGRNIVLGTPLYVAMTR